MERNEEDPILGDDDRVGREEPVLSSNLFLDHVGEVTLHIDSDGLSWALLEPAAKDRSVCFGIKPALQGANEIKFCEIYAVELIGNGLIPNKSDVSGPTKHLLGHESQMYQFTVHFAQRSKSQHSLMCAAVLTFGHIDLQSCQMWVSHITSSLNKELGDRPKNLLIFVHPMSGKGNGCRTWEAVAPIFSRAKVQTQVIVTERAGQAFNVMRTTVEEELKLYDGVVSIGGDGFFNEVLNGLLSARYKASYPPVPADFLQSLGENKNIFISNTDEAAPDISDQNEYQSPLIPDGELGCSGANGVNCVSDKNMESLFPNERFRFGIIPAGSTDAIVICTTGARDPTTSALHIVLGKRLPLDIGQIVRWKATSTSKVEPCVRYAASFAGYGFYGDVVTESEKYRWMGPKRYDYVGTKVFLRHRSYEAEVAFAEVKPEETPIIIIPDGEANNNKGVQSPKFWGSKKPRRIICRVNCSVCKSKRTTSSSPCRDIKWNRSKGRFISIGAAIMSNRNEKAPDGLVADAHLSDGFLHLILVKNCPRPFYLWHLLQLAKKDGNPLNFDFVEHHKTRAFTFKSSGNSSVWNIDGEPFQAHQLSAQVFRGLISMFAPGPEI